MNFGVLIHGRKHHFTNLGPLGPQWAPGPRISDVMVFGPRKAEPSEGPDREAQTQRAREASGAEAPTQGRRRRGADADAKKSAEEGAGAEGEARAREPTLVRVG